MDIVHFALILTGEGNDSKRNKQFSYEKFNYTDVVIFYLL